MRHANIVRMMIVTTLGACFTALAQTTQTTAPGTQPVFEQQLARIDALAAKVSDLTATFEQRKYSPLLRDPLVTRGTIRARGAAMVWEATEPEPTRTRVTQERLQIYFPAQNLVEDYPIAGKLGSLAASPLPRLGTLRERFAIAPDAGEGLTAPADVKDAVALRLTPLEEDVKQYVGHVRVLLDAARGLVVMFELVDPDGERTTIAFNNLRTNTGLTDAALELGAAPGAKVVRPLEPGR